MEAWRRLSRRSLAEIVVDALRCAPPIVAAEFTRVIAGEVPIDQHALRIFARYGLFVHEQEGRLSLNPLIASSSESDFAALDGRVPVPAIGQNIRTLLVRHRRKALVWQRRRDRQIIQYLAMQPDGRATQAQLISTFWPDADPQLAGQSLRTARSTIRRAFAECVERANVSRYFSAEHFFELKLDVVISSVARFQTHIGHADSAFDSGDARAAYAHYSAAEKLYISPLLAGEPSADWSEIHAARLASMRMRESER